MARPTLFSHRKYLRLARALKSEALALGHLEFVWHAANESGEPIVGSKEDVEAVARWSGEPGELADLLVKCGFLDVRDDGRLEIHDYWHHCPEYARSRRGREDERKTEKTCASCGLPYFSSDPRSEHCSAACRTRKWRQRQRDGSVTDMERTHASQIHSDTHAYADVTLRDTTPAPAPAPAPNTQEENTLVADATRANGIDRDLEQQIVAAYHEQLPDLPKVKVWSDKRRRLLKARIREHKARGQPADTPDYWQRVFRKAAASDFLCGRDGGKWRADLEWLLGQSNFIKLIEGKYDNHGDRNGRS